MKSFQTFIMAFTMFDLIKSNIDIDELKRKKCMLDPIQNLKADIILGAIFPVQGYDAIYQKYIFDPNAVVWVESFQYALDEINRNPDILPDISLGYDIRNNCNNQELTLYHTVDLMIDTRYYDDVNNNGGNSSDKSTVSDYFTTMNRTETCSCQQNKTSKIAGVIGGHSSELSGVMSHLLSTDLIPQISYGAASPTLDKTIYRSFLRTLPKDSYQAVAISDLLNKYNWTYTTVIASDDDYGRLAVSELRKQMKQRDMCIATEHFFDPTFPGKELNKTINEIVAKIHLTNVVILWCGFQPALSIISETYRQGYRNITWIGTESWGNAMKLTDYRLELNNLSVISIALREQTIPAFEEYINDLSWVSNFSNPWLASMWEELYYCPLPPKPWPPFGCVPIEPRGNILPKYKHYNVMAAVYAVAMGLHSFFQCQNSINGVYTCPGKHTPIDYAVLLEHIKTATFTVKGSSTDFHFDQDGNAAFSSYNFKTLLQPQPKKIMFKEIGQWHGEKNVLNVDQYTPLWNNNVSVAKGVCSLPCKPGSYILRSPVSCCWSCYQCSVDTISINESQSKCEPCSETEISNKQHTKCLGLERKNFSFYNIQGQITLAASMFGVLLVIIVMIVFLKHWESPVVKSSSREMSLIQLTSMLLLFCLPYLHMIKITTPICIAQVASIGLLYAHIIAFIVIKTYRLLRVFNRQRFTELSKYLQNKYQVLFSFLIVLVELIGIILWYSVPQNIPVAHVFRLKARSEDGHSKTLSYIDSCGEREEYIIYGVIAYICVLSFVSGYMAFRARSLPENFNEAQFIWFAMFTTLLVWCLFFLLYLSLDRTQKPIVFLCTSLANNFCLLFLLYGYKLYIILCMPQLNTQANFRKMAVNATVTTFYKEVDPTGVQRPREQSVISFDFDDMFDEYRNRRHNTPPANAGIARRITFRIQKHFPSLKRKKSTQIKGSPVQKRINRKRRDNIRNQTIQIPHEEHAGISMMQRSISLDEAKVRGGKQIVEERLSSSISTSELSKRNRTISVKESSTDTTEIGDETPSLRLNSTSLTSLISKKNSNEGNPSQVEDNITKENKDITVDVLQIHGIMGTETFL